MHKHFLDTEIVFLKGVGPKRASLLKDELGIECFSDLLEHHPFRYIDRNKIYDIISLRPDMGYVLIEGRFTQIQVQGQGRGARLNAIFSDETGNLELVWFKGIKWVQQKINLDSRFKVFGKISVFRNSLNISHPEIEIVSTDDNTLDKPFYPIYHTTEKLKNRGLDSKGISKLIINLLAHKNLGVNENLSQDIIDHHDLLDKHQTMRQIHFPDTTSLLKKARHRIIFEELFFTQLSLLRLQLTRYHKNKGVVFEKVGASFNQYYSENLPFELTNAQKRVVKEIRKDLYSGHQMNRLLQGDVGSGKTLVALLSMLIAIDNGYQACLMAPTEILAAQHFKTLSKALSGIEVKIGLLTGSSKSAARKKLHEELLSGECNILVGTHALLEDVVQFKNLGLVVIDEQHRFGVAQRAKLWTKGTIPPHILVMTATPIPRTLSMTIYGDLDISIIDELPPGRKSIKTIHATDSDRLKVFGFMRDQIKEGRQIYIVYPLIHESKKMDLKDLMDGYESICRAFPLPDYAISIVHGQMKSKEKEYEMQRFIKGETQIMVSTTVIEVGVDIPNASVMVIENAERFGLSQLHQLRGRVGRGGSQSYCILVSTQKLTPNGKRRIKTMVDTNDGFKIAETDLEIRGPGDMQGTQQSGIIDFKMADLIRDEKIMKISREAAEKLLSVDPQLKLPENQSILIFYLNNYYNKKDWAKIS